MKITPTKALSVRNTRILHKKEQTDSWKQYSKENQEENSFLAKYQARRVKFSRARQDRGRIYSYTCSCAHAMT